MTYYYILIGISVLLIVTFPFMLNKLSQESGWRELVKSFGVSTTKSISGESLSVRSAHIGGFAYRNVLRIKSTKKGLLIKMTWPFSMSHKAVLIPWKYMNKTKSSDPKEKVKSIAVGKPAITDLRFNDKDFKKINAVINRRG